MKKTLNLLLKTFWFAALFFMLSIALAVAQDSDPGVIIDDTSGKILEITLAILAITEIILRLYPSFRDNTIVGNVLRWLVAISDYLSRRKK